MKFDPADIRSIIEQHEKIRAEDEFRAMEIAEAAARFAMSRTECSLDELQTALQGDYNQATEAEQNILKHFYHFMDEAQN